MLYPVPLARARGKWQTLTSDWETALLARLSHDLQTIAKIVQKQVEERP